MANPTVSIIIGNYNYGRFLCAAIDSALGQTYPYTEVIVVDDGSIDNSQDVIASYGNRVVPLFKKNGGMGSTYNAGFPLSRGEVVLFLDSDDTFLPSTVGEAIQRFDGPDVAKVHWPLYVVDEQGRRTGDLFPSQPLSEGDFREATLAQGPDSYVSPPTTGNAWSRRFLQDVLPLPESEYRQHADTYLYTLAPVFGTIRRVREPQAHYRVHGGNDYACRPADEKNRRNLEIYERRCDALSKYLASKGVRIDPGTWKERNPYYSWMRRLSAATDELAALIPAGSSLILVDEDQWADRLGGSEVIGGRQAIPFLEHEGRYWGPPSDDQTAITEFDRLRGAGARFIAFAWPAFWWLQHYAAFAQHLRVNYRCVLENDRLVVFDLRQAR
jgi:glycosyltransferase involved in cell wall biosynthesis